jgi:hypothetical protein
MSLINSISNSLSKRRTQRICYIVALAIWILIWCDDLKLHKATSSLGIKYVWLMAVPTILLTIQIVFNNILVWAVIWGLIIFYTFWTTYELVMNLKIEFVFPILLIMLILLIINWIVFKLKPESRIENYSA